MNETLRKIWGIKFEEIFDGNYLFFKLYIRNPFELEDNKLRVGINEKLLAEAQKRGVHRFIIGERMIPVPTEKELKNKIKAKEFEDKPSMFQGSKPMRIYYFIF